MNTRTEDELYVDTDFRILFEDSSLVVVEKPAPLPVHAVGTFKKRNLHSLLIPKINSEFLAPVNRLDSETSGLVLFAKTSQAAGTLGSQFENRSVEKEYLGIVFGHPQLEKGSLKEALGFDNSLGYRRRILNPNGETAHTDYEWMESKENYSLLRIFPKTGRTHQIRAHLAFAGHPLVGDKIYIQDTLFEPYIQKGWQEWMREIVKSPRLLLHALRLKFRHPETEKEMEFISEKPQAMELFWRGIR